MENEKRTILLLQTSTKQLIFLRYEELILVPIYVFIFQMDRKESEKNPQCCTLFTFRNATALADDV